jgi:hypothetical protein
LPVDRQPRRQIITRKLAKGHADRVIARQQPAVGHGLDEGFTDRTEQRVGEMNASAGARGTFVDLLPAEVERRLRSARSAVS